MSSIKIGIIGHRKHAKKIISIVENIDCFSISHIYHPFKKVKEDSRFTNNFDDLFNCDAVIISSPNSTHYEYIMKLLEKPTMLIFCEKPPVVNFVELDNLSNLSLDKKKRIFFNFNLRFCELNSIIENLIVENKIGDIIHVDIIASHGLAFKPEYKNSWRSDESDNIHNLLDAAIIHFVDLFQTHLGKILNTSYYPRLISGIGSSFDTATLAIEFDNKATLSILSSYSAPYLDKFMIVGTNGYVLLTDKELLIHGPRDTFDHNGNFSPPPILKKIKYSFRTDVNNSLIKSIKEFFRIVKENSTFDVALFDRSLNVNRIILNFKTEKK